MATKSKIPDKLQIWIDARKRFHLSHAQIQMARELGMNPKKFGSLANHKQEPWKAPLPIFIQECYFKQFKKNAPDRVLNLPRFSGHGFKQIMSKTKGGFYGQNSEPTVHF